MAEEENTQDEKVVAPVVEEAPVVEPKPTPKPVAVKVARTTTNEAPNKAPNAGVIPPNKAVL